MAPARAERVDLRFWQTPFRNQGGRDTCVTFCSIAAVEAAYTRAGYGALDLSEDFANNVGKMLNLDVRRSRDGVSAEEPIWRLGSDWAENLPGFTGGTGGWGVFSQGFGVPREADMPYRASDAEYTGRSAHPSWTDVWWNRQWNTNSFNLDEANLPFSAVTAPLYYSARPYHEINSRSVTEVQNALRSGHEVAWHFSVAGDRSGAIWRYTGPAPADAGGHCMLIVGFDNTDPGNSYFIVKNSYGPASANADGFVRISYAYLQNYGYHAGYIEGVNPPRARPELAFIGRWSLCFDGWRGTLDIYHIPSMVEAMPAALGVPDRRLGTFRDPSGQMYRVNGSVSGDQITFWLTPPPNDNLRWDTMYDVSGRLFRYRLVPGKRGMAGWHQDSPSGSFIPQWSGYASKDGFLTPVFNDALPRDPNMYLGRWRLTHQYPGIIRFLRRDDTRVPLSQRSRLAGLVGTYQSTGSTVAHEFVAFVDKADPNAIEMTLPLSETVGFPVNGRMLSWQRGVIAGSAFYAVRLGD
jgi:hypothetical protein